MRVLDFPDGPVRLGVLRVQRIWVQSLAKFPCHRATKPMLNYWSLCTLEPMLPISHLGEKPHDYQLRVTYFNYRKTEQFSQICRCQSNLLQYKWHDSNWFWKSLRTPSFCSEFQSEHDLIWIILNHFPELSVYDTCMKKSLSNCLYHEVCK